MTAVLLKELEEGSVAASADVVVAVARGSDHLDVAAVVAEVVAASNWWLPLKSWLPPNP